MDDKYGFFMYLMDLIWVWSYPISWNLSMLLGILNLFPNLSVFISVLFRILLFEVNMFVIPSYSLRFLSVGGFCTVSQSLTAVLDMGS